MEFDFHNFKELNISVNRCMGYTQSGKKCRTRLRHNQYLFCCESHKPYNKEILEEGCFCCMEKIINQKDGIFFKCKHLVHKSCYVEWAKSENNTYEVPICIICREDVYQKQKKKRSLPNKMSEEDTKKLDAPNQLIQETMENHKIYDQDYQENVKKFIFSDSFIILSKNII
jgi:hypothetical protein